MRERGNHKNDKKKPCLCNEMSCTTTSYVGGGESPLFSDWFANPRAFPLRGGATPCAVNCCVCNSVRLMVDVPLVIGAVGDIDVDAGNSGAVSALSWYGRLKENEKRFLVDGCEGVCESLTEQSCHFYRWNNFEIFFWMKIFCEINFDSYKTFLLNKFSNFQTI